MVAFARRLASSSHSHHRRLVLIAMASVLLLSGCMLSPLFQAPAAIMTGIAVLLGLAACGGGGGGGGGGTTETPAVPPHWPAVVSLSWLYSTSDLGVLLYGGGGAGWSVSAGQDVNGDLKGDLLIGAPYAYAGSGAAYLVFGGADVQALAGQGWTDLGTLGSSQALLMTSTFAPGGNVGQSVLLTPDMNGSGPGEVVIGAPSANTNHGRAWVLFGDANLSSLGTLDLGGEGVTPPFDGSGGFAMYNSLFSAQNRLGYALATGDINHDGKADLIVGAPRTIYSASDPGPHATIVLGSASNLGVLNDGLLSTPGSSGAWFTQDIAAANRQMGQAVATGKINGDGFADLVIGQPGLNLYSYYGLTAVVFGASGDGTALPPQPSSLDGSNGFRIHGGETYTSTFTSSGVPWYRTDLYARDAGSPVTVGDLDGDGLGDIIVGAKGVYFGAYYDASGIGTFYSSSYAQLHVVFANTVLGAPDVYLGDGNSQGLVINLQTYGGYGSVYQYVTALATADINGDGIQDLIVGVSSPKYYIYPHLVIGYVIFGGSNLHGATIDVSTLDGTQGFKVIAPYSHPHQSIAIGDVNGDGIPDVIIGSAYNGYGNVYIIFGLPPGGSFPDYVPPAPPANVAAVSGADLSCAVDVTWDAVAGADSYTLYWSDIQGAEYPSGTKVTGVSSPWSLDTGLLTPFIMITTVIGGEESLPSAEVTATPGTCLL